MSNCENVEDADSSEDSIVILLGTDHNIKAGTLLKFVKGVTNTQGLQVCYGKRINCESN